MNRLIKGEDSAELNPTPREHFNEGHRNPGPMRRHCDHTSLEADPMVLLLHNGVHPSLGGFRVESNAPKTRNSTCAQKLLPGLRRKYFGYFFFPFWSFNFICSNPLTLPEGGRRGVNQDRHPTSILFNTERVVV